MARKVTRTSVQILEKVQYLILSALTQLEVVSTKLTEAFNPPPSSGEPDAPPINWSAVQTSHIQHLEEAAATAVEAAQAHRAAKVETADALKWRNNVTKEIDKRYRQLRTLFKAVYSTLRWHLLDLDEPPERQNMAMRERCRDFYNHLRDPQMPAKLGDPENGQQPIDLDRVAATFGPQLEIYENALDRWTEARKRRDDALVTKQEAEDRLRLVYANIARVQEGYFRLAGLEELAERIRLTIPRSSKKEITEPVTDGDPVSDGDSVPDSFPPDAGTFEPTEVTTS